MIVILSHVVEVVVLSTRTNAFLGIGSALQMGKVCMRIDSTKEDVLVMAHASISEE